MEHLEFVVDPFCEKAFWAEQKIDVYFTNPVCAATGVIMVFMALGSRSIKDDSTEMFGPTLSITALSSRNLKDNSTEMFPTLSFMALCSWNLKDNSTKMFPTLSITILSLCRGALAVVGIGTTVFHLIDDQTHVPGFNFRMCDRMPIILMCSNVFLLYFVKLLPSVGERVLTFFYFLMYIYIGGLILAVDSSTYEYLTLKRNDPPDSPQSSYESYMNIALLAPLGIILLIAMCYKFTGRQTVWILVQLVFSLGIWCIDAYFCRQYTWLFVLHAVYHVTIAYTFLYAACLAMTFDGEWEMEQNSWWPMVKQVEQADKKSMNCGFRMSPCDIKIHLKP